MNPPPRHPAEPNDAREPDHPEQAAEQAHDRALERAVPVGEPPIAPHAAAQPGRSSLKAAAVRGSAWTLIGHGGEQAIRLAANLALARLLTPEIFGLMGIVSVVTQGLKMFSDTGIGPSIIQNKREDTDFLNTAWTVQVIRGFALWTLCAAAALPIAWIYGEPIFALLLPIAGINTMIAGFNTTALFTMNRKLEFAKISIVRLSGATMGSMGRVGFALLTPTVWAMVAGGTIGAVSTLVLGFAILRTHRHRLRLERAALGSLFGFGKWIFLSTAVTFLAMQADRFAVPALSDMTTFGLYSIALVLGAAPLLIVNKIAARVMFPAYARVVRDGTNASLVGPSRKFARAVVPAFAVPAAFILFGRDVVDILYPAEFSRAGDFLEVLSVAVYIDMLRASLNGAFHATGDSRSPFIVNSVRLGVGLPIAVLLMLEWGAIGFCAGQVVAASIAFLCQRALVRRRLEVPRSSLDLALLLGLVAVLVGREGLRSLGVVS
ncbi:MAG: oligosaccharide flippase family protein [Planctomycetota bacterium]